MKRIEDHLLNCPACMNRVEQLSNTEKLLKELPKVSPANDVWPRINTGLSQHSPNSSPTPFWQKVAIFTLFGLMSGLAGTAMYLKLSGNENLLEAGIRTGEFKPVSIQHMSVTTEPHVVTEGYVTEARLEREDGDMVFKLVEDPNSDGPFVICEVIEPLNLPIPPIGSKVRVYGVSRYDGKVDHQWHEVHPVLDIEVLKN